ncbi:unnamed protein product [Paramecium octaurelia]|uniref:Uncharacterized protein n=1 Tax=Paramecium octaurelia TaxID=43137 RepID=A0A8S1XYM4_PAROT|nr:unnamed protein product [Paramecium octaurelia]
MPFAENEQESIKSCLMNYPNNLYKKQANNIRVYEKFQYVQKTLQARWNTKSDCQIKNNKYNALNLMLDFCDYVNTDKNQQQLIFGVFNRECYRQYEEMRNNHYQQVVKIYSDEKIKMRSGYLIGRFNQII